MNIKGLVHIAPTETKPIERSERTIKSDITHDRDPSGQQFQGQQEEKRPPMTDEQIEKALEHLRSLPAFKEHKWTAHLDIEDDQRFVFVKDNLGNVIRKIPELELWSLPSSIETRGQLIKRTA